MRHPHLIGSVRQYRSEEQQEQLQHHIVSESFIPMAPDLVKPPRKRRRPPFSYSSLIAQAILESKEERMALRDIYNWITEKYPALYNAQDTGWQNTIRHNLSLNKCFRKIPKSENETVGRGKGGYWTIDPNHMAKFKNGSFARGSASSMRRKPTREDSDKRQSPLPETTADSAGSLLATPRDNYLLSRPDKTSNHSSCVSPSIIPTVSPAMKIHNLLN
ncbi:fork head domain-containing protein [Phycomyces blakesleeanus]|uniref:Fork head domain-containing protein n=1 Tax=Phycomyces blakesleeanus TaxID=4837 RepID=A0ABR3B5S5_PHYBL